MSLAEQVGQILWLGFEGEEIPEWLDAECSAGGVGAIVLFKRNLPICDGVLDLEAMGDLNRRLHDMVPELLIAVDQEGGRVARIKEPATEWPAMGKLESRDPATAFQVGTAMGAELAALGFDIDFAPVLDVHTNPDNPIIGDRAFATTPDRVVELALAFAEGMLETGMFACGKHFPGHGDTDVDSHLALPRLPHGLERLREVELVPFARASRAGLPMLMTAHVVFEALDPQHPATLSPRVINEILRRELGFSGVVVSDDLDMKAIADHYGAGDAACRAIRAGCDALLLCRDRGHQIEAKEALLAEAEKDAEFRARIGQAAERVASLKARPRRPRPQLSVVGCNEHRSLAASIA